MRGLFDLLSGDDLCAKLEHDYERVSRNPADVFAAFDFLVTAWHLLEWKYPGKSSQKQREDMYKQYPILALCEHLAVGGKHFEPANKKLNSVSETRRDSVWERGVWAPGVWQRGTWKDDLVVELTGEARVAFGARLTMKELADLVMKFWRETGGCSKSSGMSGSSI
jgi:hypothetical protein